MLARLPYRLQIPLGLSLAVLLAALLVTAVTARHSAQAARLDIDATAERAASLLGAQALPLLAADDTWRVFALLRNTGALLPGAEAGQARAAVLDSEGRVFAASDPLALGIGTPLLGLTVRNITLPTATQIGKRLRLGANQGALTLIDPLRSEDGQLLGFGYIEIDAPVFATDWAALGGPALIGVAVAVALLVPVGWWTGRRMTRPVGKIARVIERIGRDDPSTLRAEVPQTRDPELGRICAAVEQLIGELQVRKQAEQRALSAERMATVGRMTAAVAHEINNPLGGLLNATKTLALHGASEDTRKRTLDLLERGLLQIRTTVAALVPQARKEDRPLEPGDLDDVITLVQPSVQHRGIQLTAVAEVESALRVPSATMRQVMLNLMLNAANAAGDRGRVDARLHANAEVVRFTVANTGGHLSRQQLEKSIAAESTNDPRGFGLWVCREIAVQYGGGFDVGDPCDRSSHTDRSSNGDRSSYTDRSSHGDRTDHAALATQLVFWMPNRERHEEPVAH